MGGSTNRRGLGLNSGTVDGVPSVGSVVGGIASGSGPGSAVGTALSFVPVVGSIAGPAIGLVKLIGGIFTQKHKIWDQFAPIYGSWTDWKYKTWDEWARLAESGKATGAQAQAYKQAFLSAWNQFRGIAEDFMAHGKDYRDVLTTPNDILRNEWEGDPPGDWAGLRQMIYWLDDAILKAPPASGVSAPVVVAPPASPASGGGAAVIPIRVSLPGGNLLMPTDTGGGEYGGMAQGVPVEASVAGEGSNAMLYVGLGVLALLALRK